MRVVPSPHTSAAPSDRPGREHVESVRYLADRCAAHGLCSVQVVRAPRLDRLAAQAADARERGGTRVWLALETMQVTGSFKVRGALAALGALAKRTAIRPLRVVTASAGNHGAGLAFAARALGAQASIVVPKGVPDAKRSKIEAYGARILLAETDSFDDAETTALAMARDEGVAFVSAYDDVDVVAGNGGSLGFEIARALGKVPEMVVCPLGGGGLATGLSWALSTDARDAGLSPPLVWGVQSEASPAMALSLERGAAIERMGAAGPTLAEGLEGGIAAPAFARAREAIAGVVVASEEDTARAMVYAYRDMGLVVEGSGAIALTPILAGLPAAMTETPSKSVDVVVVLTGRNVDPARLARVLAEHGPARG